MEAAASLPPCPGCWRSVPVAPTPDDLDLCGQCSAQIKSYSAYGAASEGGKHARRLIETWRGQETARDAYASGRTGR